MPPFPTIEWEHNSNRINETLIKHTQTFSGASQKEKSLTLDGMRREYEVLNGSCLFANKMGMSGVARVLTRWSLRVKPLPQKAYKREQNEVLVIIFWLLGQLSLKQLIFRYFNYIRH